MDLITRTFSKSHIITGCKRYVNCDRIGRVYISDYDWRIQKKLPSNPNMNSKLTNDADFVFVDGRPSPYCNGQMRRIYLQKAYGKRVVECLKIVHSAKETYAQKIAEEHRNIENHMGKKLKAKGSNLLKKS